MLIVETYIMLKEADYKIKDLTGFEPKDIFRRTSQIMESCKANLSPLRIGTVELEEIFAHLLLSYIYTKKKAAAKASVPDYQTLLETISAYERILRTYLAGDAKSAVIVLCKILENSKHDKETGEGISYDKSVPFFAGVIKEFDPSEPKNSLGEINTKYGLADSGVTASELAKTQNFFYKKRGSLYSEDLPRKMIFDTTPSLVEYLKIVPEVAIATEMGAEVK